MNKGELAKIQTEVEGDVKEMQNLQKELQKLNESRAKLIEQQNESEMVSKEINLLEAEAVIYKLSGPVLIKQSLGEAKQVVQTRLDYIRKESIRGDLLIQNNETKQHDKKIKIQNLQEIYYKIAMAAQQQAQAQAQQQQQIPAQ